MILNIDVFIIDNLGEITKYEFELTDIHDFTLH